VICMHLSQDRYYTSGGTILGRLMNRIVSKNRLRALQSLNTKLVGLDFNSVGYQELVDGVLKVIGCDACALLSADQKTQKLVLQAAAGYPQIDENLEIPYSEKSSAHVQAVVEEYFVHIPATAEVPDVITLDLTNESCLVIPILVANRCLGVLDFSCQRPRSFSEEDIDLAYMLVDQMAYLLENQRLMAELAASRGAVIRGMALLAESRDGHIGGHLERICAYSGYLAQQLMDDAVYRKQLDPDLVHNIAQAAALHDIGKVATPDQVLLKPHKLTSQEHDVIKCHTTAGYELLQNLIEPHGSFPVLLIGAELAWAHHENWDGSGYPRGLSGEDIPLSARIVALADVYDALTSKRIYKEAWEQNDAAEMVRAAAGEKFDPHLTEIFLQDLEKLHEIAQIRDSREV